MQKSPAALRRRRGCLPNPAPAPMKSNRPIRAIHRLIFYSIVHGGESIGSAISSKRCPTFRHVRQSRRDSYNEKYPMLKAPAAGQIARVRQRLYLVENTGLPSARAKARWFASPASTTTPRVSPSKCFGNARSTARSSPARRGNQSPNAVSTSRSCSRPTSIRSAGTA